MMQSKSSERRTSAATELKTHARAVCDSTREVDLFFPSSPTDHQGYEPSPSYTDEMISPVTLRGDMLVW